MFTNWLIEAYYLRLFFYNYPRHHIIQHITKIHRQNQHHDARKAYNLFIYHLYRNETHIYQNRFNLIQNNPCIRVIYQQESKKLRRKKYAKLSNGTDVLKLIICNIKVRQAPKRHDNIDFKPAIKMSKIKPLSVSIVADKGYDNEDNHVMVIKRN